MDFFETVEKRRSVRKFTDKKVPEEVVRKAIQAALLAPNSSNLQAWEFYWVRSEPKKIELVKACFSQNAAATAQELIVVVSRVDTWKRNSDLLLQEFQKLGKVPRSVLSYYKRVVPTVYLQDPFGILGVCKWLVFSIAGLFRPVPRKPRFRFELFETVSKSTALGCENLMLALTAQGFASCPMEGFDECRVKKILGLGCKSHVVMVIGLGEEASDGVFSERIRIPESLVSFEV